MPDRRRIALHQRSKHDDGAVASTPAGCQRRTPPTKRTIVSPTCKIRGSATTRTSLAVLQTECFWDGSISDCESIIRLPASPTKVVAKRPSPHPADLRHCDLRLSPIAPVRGNRPMTRPLASGIVSKARRGANRVWA